MMLHQKGKKVVYASYTRPQLDFIRSYSNRNTPENLDNTLGEGWNNFSSWKCWVRGGYAAANTDLNYVIEIF